MKKKISIVLFLALGMMAEVANADFIFGEPTNLGPTVNSSFWDYDPSISADELELYFMSNRPGGSGSRDLWMTTRASASDPWGTPVNLGPTVNTTYEDCCPDISANGLTLFFHSTRPGGYGMHDLWVTTRETTNDPWGEPVNLGPAINTSAEERGPTISDVGLSLFFFSTRPGGSGGWDLWVTTRSTVSNPWGEPVNLGRTVNSSANDAAPDISVDRLSLFFLSTRSGGYGAYDLWVTRRETIHDPWSTPVNLGAKINSSAYDFSPNISPDGSNLFFTSGRPGGLGGDDIWQVAIIPIVDFNADGIVDKADMCIMVDHWGENYPLCDIGPTPFGDGIVDVQDLIVLAEYFAEELNNPTLVAHWALDETEGMVVADSVGENNGYALGDPVWQPDGGLVDGALQLDGVDDYIITGATPNPADGPFSVLAWINGGAPGQVVVSQQGAANWLMADAEGNLMTGLKGSRRDDAELTSQTIITDGDWHRIGFTWDGSNRTLYVDDIAVAQDTQDGLKGSAGGMYIGCGKDMEAGTFWSGLIDDVRIYSRAVYP